MQLKQGPTEASYSQAILNINMTQVEVCIMESILMHCTIVAVCVMEDSPDCYGQLQCKV